MDDLRLPVRCGERVHQACACVRPAGHAGPCSCDPADGPHRFSVPVPPALAALRERTAEMLEVS